MTITERIFSADYTEGLPEVLVGYCFSTICETSDGFEVDTLKGLRTSVRSTNVFNRNVQYGRSFGTTVDIKHGFNAYKLDPDFIINPPSLVPIAPTLGPVVSLPEISGGPPAFEIPGKLTTNPFTISEGGETITLKSPKFSDTDTLDYRRVNSQTIGGKLIIYRDPNWSAKESINFQWENLEKLDYKNLLDFLLRKAGRTLTLVDHHGFTWTCKQSNVGAEGSEGANDRYGYQLEVETVDA